MTRGDFLKSPLPANSVNTQAISDGSVTAVKTSFGGNFSTSEVNTGFTWVNGNVIYKKTIDTGTIPNSTSKLVPHGITGITYVISIEGIGQESANTFFPLPLLSSLSGNAIAGIGVVGANIRIGSNATIPSLGSYVTIYYTK